MTVMSEETALEECSSDRGGSPEKDGQSFSSALEQISKQELDNRNFATHILTWLKFAKESPTAVELVQSYAIQQTKDASNRDLDRPEGDIPSVCKGLVTMDPSTKTVRAVHKSVLGLAQECELVHPDPLLYILRACLTYLEYDELAIPMRSQREINIRLQKYPLLKYAAGRLMSDPRGGRKEAVAEAKALITEFLHDNSRATSWYQVVARRPNVRITGLHAAIHMSKPTIAYVLLKPGKGGNVNARDSRGETPLHWAAARQHPSLVRLLLKNSARLDCKDSSGDTPLRKALMPWPGRHPYARIRTVYELVLRAGIGAAQMSISKGSGHTPIHLLEEHGPGKLARFLVRCQPVKSIGGEDGRWSAWRQITKSVLLHAGAHVSRPTRDPERWHPLIEAVRCGNGYWARALLQSGVPVDVQDAQGMTPLRCAIVSDREFLVRLLLENGAA
ncbi:hypothetical protein J3459_017391 [Metarhizium acridum]|nr:hypothetical protein J3459_017391 [Metarhizium acridum]